MWDSVFSPDSIFIRTLTRISDVFILSIIYVISCIPIITIGASTTALYYTAITSISREDGYIFQMFWKSFKRNFKQSTIIWLITAAIGIILSTDVYFWFVSWTQDKQKIAQPLLFVSVVLLILYILIMTYLFPLQAKFDNKIGVTIRNAFLLAIKYFPQTLLLIAIPCLIISLVFITGYGIILILILGAGTAAFLQAFIYRSIFKQYIPDEEVITEGNFNLDDIGSDDNDSSKESTTCDEISIEEPITSDDISDIDNTEEDK